MAEFYAVQNPPQAKTQKQFWGRLYGAANALAISNIDGFNLIIVATIDEAIKLKQQLAFYAQCEIATFPHLETLAYDHISPHQDIVSKRLAILQKLPQQKSGFLITTVATALQKLPPKNYIADNSLVLAMGQSLDFTKLIQKLEKSGFNRVNEVLEHGEFSVRGEIIDLFPMGHKNPVRLDFFDNEIETIKYFATDNQLSTRAIDAIEILPASEIQLDKSSIKTFKTNWLKYFNGEIDSVFYQAVMQQILPAGIEYYLPLFFAETNSIFDYLPANATVITGENLADAIQTHTEDYQQRFNDNTGPKLTPKDLILAADEFFAGNKQFKQINIQQFAIDNKSYAINFNSSALPSVVINHKLAEPMSRLLEFMKTYSGRILFVAESQGRKEILKQMLIARKIMVTEYADFAGFIAAKINNGIVIGDLDLGLKLPNICVLTESSLFGNHIKQRKLSKTTTKDGFINSLLELKIGQAVVHVDSGIGRYQGLKTLTAGGQLGEYLVLEYAKKDILYVPVDSLNLIHRYTGTDSEHAPLHRLGSNQWDKAKRKAKSKAYDVAAELLEIYARRLAANTIGIKSPDEQYQLFAASFAFEPTIDQQQAIDDTIKDLQTNAPMDRLVCGDVGFGKTEVAMRAVFLVAQNQRQIAVLVPTTLLAQQHYQSFQDRFADWSINIAILSRFQTTSETKITLNNIKTGFTDIVIGTHKLLSQEIEFNNLGLLIIDEEHRFGVKQKEKFKALRAEIDILTLSATPIPRTLNLSISGLRDLSIIATPPNNRMAIKTFVHQWDNNKIRDCCTREINRGGQVYFLHNRVADIDKIARELAAIVPKANIAVAHGQIPQHQLESVMQDFYHRKINILVCSTIIESGLDIPTANTIIINRADTLGLAQLYQIRGRVGRSHHQAYAYLITPENSQLTANAKKRLLAIDAIEELGAGFNLALQDMEIRGTGEILGDEQSGQILEIGFAMYSEILEQAVADLKSSSGKTTKITKTEINLGETALIPEDYVPDVNTRLVLYKKISTAQTTNQLQQVEVELIDRFGLLPDIAKNLFDISNLKLQLTDIGIKKIVADQAEINIEFNQQPNIEPDKLIKLIQQQPQKYKIFGADKLKITKDFAHNQDKITEILLVLSLIRQ